MSPAEPAMKPYPPIEHHPSEPRHLQFVGTSQTVAMCMDEDAAKKLVEAWNANASLPPEPREPRAMHVTFRDDGSPSNVCMAIQDVHPESVVFVELLPGYELVKTGEVLPEQEEPVAPAFKVGDRVVTQEFDDYGFVSEMREFSGKEGAIAAVLRDGWYEVHGWNWPASALTPAPESGPAPGFKYYRVTSVVDSVIWKVPADDAPICFWRRPGSTVWVPCYSRMTDLQYLTETDAAGVPLEGGGR